MKVRQLIAEVRLLLDEPNSQHPTERHVWTVVQHNLQNMANELSNSGQRWNINSWQLDVVKDQDEYAITVPEWGKPIFVLTKHADPQTPDWEVPIVDFENFNFPVANQSTGWWWGAGSSGHSAAAIAFYGKDSIPLPRYCRLTPTPTEPASYTIWYQVGTLPESSLDTEMLLPEHYQLLVTRSALGCIPYCKWDILHPDPTGGKMAFKVNELKQALNTSRDLQENAYAKYKSNLRQETMMARYLFGEFDG